MEDGNHVSRTLQLIVQNDTEHSLLIEKSASFLQEGKWLIEPLPRLANRSIHKFIAESSALEDLGGQLMYTLQGSTDTQVTWVWHHENDRLHCDGKVSSTTSTTTLQLNVTIEGNYSMNVTICENNTVALQTMPQSDMEVEQDVYLKKILVKHAVEKEMDAFRTKPTVEGLTKNTLFFKFVYFKYIAGCPLFNKRGKSVLEKMDELMLQYPNMAAVHRKATKDTATPYGVAVQLIDLVVVTPKEKEKQQQVSSTLLNDDTDVYISVRKEMIDVITIVMQDVASKGNAKEFFETILQSKTLQDAPGTVKRFFQCLHKIILPRIKERLTDPKKISKTKTMYHITPRRSLVAILKIANPIKLMTNLLSLFLAKPLGAKNMMQRLFEVVAEVSSTETMVKEAKKKIKNAEIPKKVKAWVTDYYDPNPSFNEDDEPELVLAHQDAKILVMQVLTERNCKPVFEASVVESMQEAEISNIYSLIEAQMRLKDKTTFIELLGDEQITSAIKEVLPVVYQPLIEIYSHADIATLVSHAFKLMKDSYKTAEDKNLSLEQKHQMFSQSLNNFLEMAFQFLKRVIKADQGIFEELMVWFTQFFTAENQMILDMEEFTSHLTDQQKADVMKEVNEYIAYKQLEKVQRQHGRVHLEHPTPVVIPKLLHKKFVEVSKVSLERILNAT